MPITAGRRRWRFNRIGSRQYMALALGGGRYFPGVYCINCSAPNFPQSVRKFMMGRCKSVYSVEPAFDGICDSVFPFKSDLLHRQNCLKPYISTDHKLFFFSRSFLHFLFIYPGRNVGKFKKHRSFCQQLEVVLAENSETDMQNTRRRYADDSK